MKKLICKLIGHKWGVIHVMENNVGQLCEYPLGRCMRCDQESPYNNVSWNEDYGCQCHKEAFCPDLEEKK